MAKSKFELLSQKTPLTIAQKLTVLNDKTIVSGEIRDILIRHLEEDHEA